MIDVRNAPPEGLLQGLMSEMPRRKDWCNGWCRIRQHPQGMHAKGRGGAREMRPCFSRRRS